jgi:hypothetical protein
LGITEKLHALENSVVQQIPCIRGIYFHHRAHKWLIIELHSESVQSLTPSGPPLVVCPRLLIQYIRSYAPHIAGGRPFIRIPNPRHSVVIVDHLTWCKTSDLRQKFKFILSLSILFSLFACRKGLCVASYRRGVFWKSATYLILYAPQTRL